MKIVWNIYVGIVCVLVGLPLNQDGTIPHEVTGRFCGAVIRMLPASAGTGIIAGASVRNVCEMAGVKNILTKSYGSNNPINLTKAPFHALSQLRTPEEIASLRNVDVSVG